jgi:hypothetical protein
MEVREKLMELFHSLNLKKAYLLTDVKLLGERSFAGRFSTASSDYPCLTLGGSIKYTFHSNNIIPSVLESNLQSLDNSSIPTDYFKFLLSDYKVYVWAAVNKVLKNQIILDDKEMVKLVSSGPVTVHVVVRDRDNFNKIDLEHIKQLVQNNDVYELENFLIHLDIEAKDSGKAAKPEEIEKLRTETGFRYLAEVFHFESATGADIDDADNWDNELLEKINNLVRKKRRCGRRKKPKYESIDEMLDAADQTT